VLNLLKTVMAIDPDEVRKLIEENMDTIREFASNHSQWFGSAQKYAMGRHSASERTHP
jgi:hypothetical protein